MIETRTHRIAKAAYECVDRRRSDRQKKEYGALAHKLPSMILQNGLAQSTGFLLAKGQAEHRAVLDDLSTVLVAAGIERATSGEMLHDLVIDSDLDGIMILTRRSLEASGWIKRYVQGLLRLDAADDAASSTA